MRRYKPWNAADIFGRAYLRNLVLPISPNFGCSSSHSSLVLFFGFLFTFYWLKRHRSNICSYVLFFSLRPICYKFEVCKWLDKDESICWIVFIRFHSDKIIQWVILSLSHCMRIYLSSSKQIGNENISVIHSKQSKWKTQTHTRTHQNQHNKRQS